MGRDLHLMISLILPSPESDCGIEFNPGLTYHLSFDRPTLKGLKLNYQLRDDTGARFKLTGKDFRGNTVDLGTIAAPEVKSSDETIVKASMNANGQLEIEPTGPLGTAQVTVTADLGEGHVLNGQLDVTIVGGVAVAFNFDAAETFPVELPQ